MNNEVSLAKATIAGLLAGVVSAIINSIVFLICHSSGIISDSIYLLPYAPMTLARVIVSSAIPSIIGSLVFFLMDGLNKNSLRVFTIVTGIVVVVSLYSIYSVTPDITLQYLLVLCVMHIVTALSLLLFIRRAKLSKQQQLNFQAT